MPTCRSCGVQLLERRRQLCPTCWPVSRNAQAKAMHQIGLARSEVARATGEDPARSLQSRENAAKRWWRARPAEAAWEANGAPTTVTREELLTAVVLRLKETTLRQLQDATGLSVSGCSMIRSGKRTPHPRHWRALAELVSSIPTS